MHKISFNNKNSKFYNDLKQAVDNYFSAKKIKPTGNFKLYLKTITLVPAAIIIYISLLVFNLPAIAAISLCALLGFTIACIGFNVMHDACHGSYSSKRWVNNTLSLTMNAIGSNAFIWKIKHNVIHHTYTNIDGVDDDIAKMPVIRLCESQPKLKMHKYQHYYALFAYCLASVSWVLLSDFKKYFSMKIVEKPITNFSLSEHAIFWISKIMYVLFYIALPIYCVGVIKFLIGFAVMHAVMGIVLGIVFQLAHAVENTLFIETPQAELKVENEWAIHQVATTSNFATGNKFVSWFLGGLNFQVEHHLFPRVSHIHYPALNAILKDCCKRNNITYNSYPTVISAIASHFRYMKRLGSC